MKRLLIACLIVASAAPGIVEAENYPARPITFILPMPPGGNSDATARTVAKLVGEELNQPIVVENRAGGGGILGMEALVRAKPDGYTIGLGTAGTITVLRAIHPKLAFDPLRDLSPVHGLVDTPILLLANPNRPFKTLDQLIAYAKREPGKLNFASSGTGTITHLAGELFQQSVGVRLTHVPYKGTAPALNDLTSGVVDLMFDVPVTTLPHIEAGKILALATLAPDRLPVLPNVPTLKERGLEGAVLASWSGVFVPKETPTEIRTVLEAAVHRALQNQSVVQQFTAGGLTIPLDRSSERFARFISVEASKAEALVKASGARAY